MKTLLAIFLLCSPAHAETYIFGGLLSFLPVIGTGVSRVGKETPKELE